MKDGKTIEELERIFHPRGVAIVGASNNNGNLGKFFLDGFIQQGFDKDNLYVVHPGEQEVIGVKAYPTAQDIPGDVDLAVVFSPRETLTVCFISLLFHLLELSLECFNLS